MVHRLSFISRNPRYIIKIYIWMWFENFCLSSEYHFWYYHYYYMVEQHYWSLRWICVLDQSNISFSEVLKFCLFPVILSYLKFQHQESSSSPKIDTNAFGTVKLEACPDRAVSSSQDLKGRIYFRFFQWQFLVASNVQTIRQLYIWSVWHACFFLLDRKTTFKNPMGEFLTT